MNYSFPRADQFRTANRIVPYRSASAVSNSFHPPIWFDLAIQLISPPTRVRKKMLTDCFTRNFISYWCCPIYRRDFSDSLYINPRVRIFTNTRYDRERPARELNFFSNSSSHNAPCTLPHSQSLTPSHPPSRRETLHRASPQLHIFVLIHSLVPSVEYSAHFLPPPQLETSCRSILTPKWLLCFIIFWVPIDSTDLFVKDLDSCSEAESILLMYV